MSRLYTPVTSTALEVAVGASHVEFAAQMAASQFWLFVSSTACWINQANASGTITCVANANMLDSDFMTINDGINAAVIYEYDKSANGVTGGRVAWAAGTTAATVAANLATAIRATQTNITVTDNGNGMLTLTSTVGNLTLTENVTDAGFLVTYGPAASAGAGSMFVPANTPIMLDGGVGSDLSVIQDATGGKATLVRCKVW